MYDIFGGLDVIWMEREKATSWAGPDIGVGLNLIDYLQYVRYGIEYSSDM